MKDQKILYSNLAEMAYDAYVEVIKMAQSSDFCKNVEALNRLNERTLNEVLRHKRCMRKVFHILVYVACLIYNNEMIADADLCYKLSVLLTIQDNKFYKLKRFKQFIQYEVYYDCIIPGMDYSKINEIIEKIKRGVLC